MTGKLLAYHLKSPLVPLVVRVPQFENHWTLRWEKASCVERKASAQSGRQHRIESNNTKHRNDYFAWGRIMFWMWSYTVYVILFRSVSKDFFAGGQARNQLGTPGGRRVFWEWPNSFKLCPIVLKYVQHIFLGGQKIIQGGFAPPGYGPAGGTDPHNP